MTSESTTRIATTPRSFATTSMSGRPTRSSAPELRSRPRSRSPGPPISRSIRWATKIEETVEGGRRTVVWKSDHPVSFFNVIAGKWEVKRGEGTAVYLRPQASVQHRRDARGSGRRPQVLLGMVLSLPVAGAQAERVPQPRLLCSGISDEHHLFRGDRLPDQEQPGNPCRLRDHRARGGPPVVGQPALAGQGPRGQHPLGGDVPLLDDPARRADQGAARPDRFLQAARGELRQEPADRLGASAGQDRRRTARRHDRHLRQGGLGLLDAPEPHGPRASLGGHSGVHQDLPRQSRPSRASGLHRVDAALRSRPGGLRRLHAAVVLRSRRARVSPA